MDVVGVLAPIFGLIVAGWLLKRLRLLNDKLVDIVNKYVYYVGISVITFVSLHDTSSSLLFDPEIYILNLLPMLAVAAMAYAAARALRLKNDVLAVFVVCAFYGNTGYIGFPLNVFVQGKESLNTAAFISTMYTIVAFTLGVYLLRKNASEPVEAGKIHKLPIIWAALLGILLSWLAIPDLLRMPLELISDSTSPLALLATGAMVEGSLRNIDIRTIGTLSIIKLAVAPALVAVTGLLLGSQGMVYRTSLLEAATPVAVTNAVLASQFKMREGFASQAVIVSTILFALTLTIILFVWR
jgi:malate permease and related proteins